MKLIIVESPTKSKSISRFVGEDYQVLSSYGHVRDLPKSKLGVDVEKSFRPEYVIPLKARKAVKSLKEAAKKTDLLILATDEDREGEAIAWHVLRALDKTTDTKHYQRIVFHEITKKAILAALANPRQLNMELVEAQQARRLLDRLVGYKLSPFLWKKVFKGLSAGRVQSVVVCLIVDRERERQAFKPEEYWDIEAILKKKRSEEFSAHLIKRDDKTIGRLDIKNQTEAENIVDNLKSAAYKIIDVQRKVVQKHPLPPFTTSTLQQTAANQLGFSSKQTMVIAQRLYEGVKIGRQGPVGLITYHRTDSLNLSADAVGQARDFIKSEFGSSYLPDKAKFYKTKSKGAQEAHEAIRPTLPGRRPEDIKTRLDARQYRLYQLIWSRFIACQMAPAQFNSIAIDISARSKSKPVYLFRANGSTIQFDGFLKVYSMKLKENLLPQLAKNNILDLVKLNPQQHFTQPPARYTEASLIKILEEYGIGRPSTYAPIISTIQGRGYTEKDEQKRFVPTEVGYLVTDLLKKHFPSIVDIEFTARMEKDLDRIAQKKTTRLKVLTAFYRPFAKNLEKKYEEVEKQNLDEATDKKCPECGSNLVIKMGRFGKFYACPKFPECRHTEPLLKTVGVPCPECGKGELVERRTRRRKIFYSCSKYPKCKFALWDKPIDKKCPKCGSLLVQKGSQVKCSSKECSHSEALPEE